MLLIIIFGTLSFPLLSAGLRSRVYETVRCPSVCASVRLSVPFAHCSSVRRVCCCGPGGEEISIDCCRLRFRGLPIAVTWGTTLSSLHVAIYAEILLCSNIHVMNIQHAHCGLVGRVVRMQSGRHPADMLYGPTGARVSRRPRRKWIDDMHDDCSDLGLTLLEATRLADDRRACRSAVYSLGCRAWRLRRHRQGTD